MAGPGDEIGAGGRGHLRASRAEREQVISTLKAAFVHGMLAKDEFDQRVSQTLAARTHADLAAVTADLPAGLAAAQPPQPAPAPRAAAGSAARQGDRGGDRAVCRRMAVHVVPWPTNSEGDPPEATGLLFFSTTLIYLFVSVIAVGFAIAGWREKRSGGQLPRRPAPGAGGQPSRRLPPAGPGGQLPPADPGHRHAAEAAPSRRPRRRRVYVEAALKAS